MITADGFPAKAAAPMPGPCPALPGGPGWYDSRYARAWAPAR